MFTKIMISMALMKETKKIGHQKNVQVDFSKDEKKKFEAFFFLSKFLDSKAMLFLALFLIA